MRAGRPRHPRGVAPATVLVDDLGPALRRTAAVGAAFLPRVLPQRLCRDVAAELAAGPFEPLPAPRTPVRQEAEAYVIRAPGGAPPLLAAVRRALVHRIRTGGRGLEGLATYLPDELHVQRYREGSVGITGHRDHRRYRQLVAVLTVEGRAGFEVLTGRHGPAVQRWETRPGSLVLLRAPGLGGLADGRPFHRVEGPRQGTRTTVTIRVDGRPR